MAAPPLDLRRYLGPAVLVRRDGEAYVVALDDATMVHATLALAFPYLPAIGDELLIIGDEQAFWIVGVLEGRGSSSLAKHRGIHCEGTLRLRGDEGVRVTGERVGVNANSWKRLAVTAVQSLGELRSHVRGRLQTDVGEADEVSERGWLLQAGRAAFKSLHQARVKSTTVRLG